MRADIPVCVWVEYTMIQDTGIHSTGTAIEEDWTMLEFFLKLPTDF